MLNKQNTKVFLVRSVSERSDLYMYIYIHTYKQKVWKPWGCREQFLSPRPTTVFVWPLIVGQKKKYPKKDKGKKWTSEQFWGSFLFGGSKKDEIRKDLMERSVVSEETLNDFPTFPYVGVR